MYEKYHVPYSVMSALVYTIDQDEPIGSYWCSYIVYPSCVRDELKDKSILQLLFPI